jgi:hypothetical protein
MYVAYQHFYFYFLPTTQLKRVHLTILWTIHVIST